MPTDIAPETHFCPCGAQFHSIDILAEHQRRARHTPTSSTTPPRQYAPADPMSPAALAAAGAPTDLYADDDGTLSPVDRVRAVVHGIPVLDPTDPFDAAVAEVVRINRRKRADYALDGDDVFSNFRQTSEVIAVDGFGPADAALFNVIQKVMRLRSLRANGRMDDPANEAAADTYLDLAVYAIIALALSREEV